MSLLPVGEEPIPDKPTKGRRASRKFQIINIKQITIAAQIEKFGIYKESVDYADKIDSTAWGER
jgi:hypothetical protein